MKTTLENGNQLMNMFTKMNFKATEKRNGFFCNILTALLKTPKSQNRIRYQNLNNQIS